MPTDTSPAVTAYEDFVVAGKRLDSRRISIAVQGSPAGRTKEAQVLEFTAGEERALHDQFVIGVNHPEGRMRIGQAAATEIGIRLSALLFPLEVFRLFTQSLRMLLDRPGTGIRIRLDMDEGLSDLPWEYVVRPDRVGHAGISGFLLLDPSVSMVRCAADKRITIRPIKGRQRMSFVGTLWEGNKDWWEVGKEFELLSRALAPVDDYVEPEYAVATDPAAFKHAGAQETAIFHYAGHCDFERDGRPYLVRENPNSLPVPAKAKAWVSDLAKTLAAAKTRLAVLSACNSGFAKVCGPLVEAGVPAIVGVNGGVSSVSTIEFCGKLYESLAVGLSLDEAVARARLHELNWDQDNHKLFDWGLFMVYLPCPEATLFPQAETSKTKTCQRSIRDHHVAALGRTRAAAREVDGSNYGEIMSETTRRRVLILGRFSGRRLKVLQGISRHLEQHPNRYIPELFTYPKDEKRNLIESIVVFAGLSRFIIADLSEPKSIPSELQAIVPIFRSIPVVPVISSGGKEYATFSAIQAERNVLKPTTQYRDLPDLETKLERLVPAAEKMVAEAEAAA